MKKYFLVVSLLFILTLLFSPIAADAANSFTVVFTKLTSYALKDPFYPNYPQRQIMFPTVNLPWWGTPGLNKYTISSSDSRVRRKTVTFYSSGYTRCANGLEMGLPFGTIPGSSYNYYPCRLATSDDFHFLFPFRSTATQLSVLDSPATISSDGGLSATIYLPLSWWNN